ncbi:MAG: ATP-binding protein [bacterium]
MRRAVLHWSGGKDSVLSLDLMLRSGDYEVTTLLATVTEEDDLSLMHRVHARLLHRQARSLGVPLRLVRVPRRPSNEVYESRHAEALTELQGRGVRFAVFGDRYLEDVRAYREKNLARIGMKGVFPLWKDPSQMAIRSFIDRGFEAVVVTVDTRILPAEYAGRPLDDDFLDDLPPGTDFCGERGEFHSFVYDGPIFSEPVSWEPGKRTREGEFAHLELLPIEQDLDR